MKTVWIVDDDEEMIYAVRMMLKLLDCEVRHFFSARLAAQTLFDGQRPDLFILDINMPGVSGIDFLEFLHRRQSRGIKIAADLALGIDRRIFGKNHLNNFHLIATLPQCPPFGDLGHHGLD